MDFYFDVFLESMLVASIIPFAHEPTVFAMREFTKYGYDYDMSLAALVATIGAALGIVFSFVLGKWFLKLYRVKNTKNQMSAERYAELSRGFVRYFTILFPFTWLPLLNLLPFVAGFLSINARRSLPLFIIGKAWYYWYYLL